MGVFISRLQVTGILVSIECGWRVTEQEPSDFYSILLKCGHCGYMPWAYCMSNRTSMTYRPLNRIRPLSVPSPPPQFHNRLPGNKKRCVLITQGCPPARPPSHQISMTSNLHRLREKHTHRILSLQLWTVLPKNPRALTKQSHAFHMSQSPRVRQVSKQIRQQNSTTESRFRSRSAPSSPKNGSPHPRTECSSMGGLRRHKCVSCKCMCAWARGNRGNHHPK